MEERKCLVNTRNWLLEEIDRLKTSLKFWNGLDDISSEDEMLIEALEENLEELERDLNSVEFELGELL